MCPKAGMVLSLVTRDHAQALAEMTVNIAIGTSLIPSLATSELASREALDRFHTTAPPESAIMPTRVQRDPRATSALDGAL
jgi:hypothetical protein